MPARRSSLALLAVSLCLCVGTSGCGDSGQPVAGSHPSSGSASQLASKPFVNDKDRDHDGSPTSRYDADDYQILAYGRAATPTEQEAVVGLLKRYYAAAALGRGSKACALMSKPLTQAIVGVYGPNNDPTAPHSSRCAPIAAHLFGLYRARMKINAATLKVRYVRLGDSFGYAILSFEGRPDRHMLMYDEAGKWTIDEALDGGLV